MGHIGLTCSHIRVFHSSLQSTQHLTAKINWLDMDQGGSFLYSMSLSEQPDAIILWWPLSLKRFVTSALLRTPYCFNALPVLDDTTIFFTENSIPRYAVSKQCPGNLNEVHLSFAPPLFTGRLGARSFTEGLTLFPSEATSRVSSRAPGLSSRDPELGDGRHYNLSTRRLYSLFRFPLLFTILRLTKQKDVSTIHHHHQLTPSRGPISLSKNRTMVLSLRPTQ
jgi:hypothetical protein